MQKHLQKHDHPNMRNANYWTEIHIKNRRKNRAYTLDMFPFYLKSHGGILIKVHGSRIFVWVTFLNQTLLYRLLASHSVAARPVSSCGERPQSLLKLILNNCSSGPWYKESGVSK